jgi:hypothetical protein
LRLTQASTDQRTRAVFPGPNGQAATLYQGRFILRPVPDRNSLPVPMTQHTRNAALGEPYLAGAVGDYSGCGQGGGTNR